MTQEQQGELNKEKSKVLPIKLEKSDRLKVSNVWQDSKIWQRELQETVIVTQK